MTMDVIKDVNVVYHDYHKSWLSFTR